MSENYRKERDSWKADCWLDDNYVGTVDMNDKEAQLDILAHLDVVPEANCI